MVFRGKPSKACERCRARRLRVRQESNYLSHKTRALTFGKCDLQKGACGQCIRADVVCSGYRDTKQLRIQDESQSIARRASRKHSLSSPQSLPLSIDSLARDAFFVYYATGTSKCWNFLKQYYHPTDTLDHLNVAIEALSLAYFWHLCEYFYLIKRFQANTTT